MIDPMVRDYARAVTSEHTNHDDCDRLAEQLTARLKRPSREEAEAFIAPFSLWSGTNRALLDYFCGPEPAPKGVEITYTKFDYCEFGRHYECPGVHCGQLLRSVCTCDCHKEASDENA